MGEMIVLSIMAVAWIPAIILSARSMAALHGQSPVVIVASRQIARERATTRHDVMFIPKAA